jgi:glycyl-tRNA synthetase beta chain
LADKIDTLVGFWTIGQKPTGSKDPFALRRAALGVLRLVVENKLRMQMLPHFAAGYVQVLPAFLRSVREEYAETISREIASAPVDIATKMLDVAFLEELLRGGIVDPKSGLSPEIEEELEANSARLHAVTADLLSFLHDRLKVFLKDQGIRHDLIDACLAMPGNDDLTLLVNRAQALAAFLKTEDGPNLLQGFKRANTILTQAETKDGVEYSYGADPKFAETDAERALFAALDTAEAQITPAMKSEDFASAMTAMATLRAPIDAFFTSVQVNSDNPITRRNRLNLLHRIRSICAGVADLTKLDG